MVLEATEAFPSSPSIEDLSSYFYTAIKIQQNGPKELKPDEKKKPKLLGKRYRTKIFGLKKYNKNM